MSNVYARQLKSSASRAVLGARVSQRTKGTARAVITEPMHGGNRPLPSRSVNARTRVKLRSFWGMLRSPKRVRATREGKWYIGITVGVGLAAINTGNNLLYLLLGMLLALMIVSFVMSELSLRKLTVVRRLPTRAQVGRPHLVEIEVFNSKTRVPSYAIEVEDLRSGQPADKRCFFLKISPGSAQVAAYRRTPQKRGLDRHIGFRLATRFPFGLFEKSREISSEGDLIIYPVVDPVRLGRDKPSRHLGGTGVLGHGGGDEIAGVRPEREGDDPRDIYWRKSTLPSHRVMRERARDMYPEVVLLLDVRLTSDSDDTMSRFERGIRDIASRAVAHIKRGDRVSIVTSSGNRVQADRTAGIDPLLRFLALVEPIRLPSAKTHETVVAAPSKSTQEEATAAKAAE